MKKPKDQFILLREDKKIYSSYATAKAVIDKYEPEYRSKYKIVRVTPAEQTEIFNSEDDSITLTPYEFGQAIHAAVARIIEAKNAPRRSV